MGIISKIRTLKECAVNDLIYRTYYKKDIDENLVYVESRDGFDFTGNIFRIVEELSTGKYGDFKIYVHAKPEAQPKIKKLQENYNLKIDKIISKEASATEVLERAKYIFTDSGIRPKYVKRQGQIFVNTWHGTPLKVMGIDNIPEEHRLGNVQHPLMSSDYLLYPNDYMKEKMLKSYMIDEIYPGKILLEGYPRNSVFFNESWLKNELGLDNYEIFAYMPTFRGILTERKDEEQKHDLDNYLSELDLKLKDNQILFVKLHVYNRSKIDFTKFKHIRDFPQGYEIYDVINMVDVLITDYSSVFFDYANSKRKIILFNYDEEDYMSYRGTYFPLSDLPFPQVQNVSDLIDELNSPKNYDDKEFLEKFCKYDNINAVENICRQIFNGEEVCKVETIEKTKKNILIYGGSLLNNGITSSLINLLDNLDKDKYNFYISFRQWDDYIKEDHEEIFQKMPNGIKYMPYRLWFNPTLAEKIKWENFLKQQNTKNCPKELYPLFKRIADRQYPNFPFDAAIDFDGYGKLESEMFSHLNVNNAIWVHNDMIQEIETKGRQNFNVLKEAYSNAANVCVVSPDLIKPTSEISGKTNNIKVIHNLNDYEKIKQKSEEEIKLGELTEIYPQKDLNEIFLKEGWKFITIGRFSPEKGHERLLKNFDKFCEDYPNTQIIIIGGDGDSYEETISLVDTLKYRDNVCLIKDIPNPMPILAQCDLFILSSFYEGWPMVLMEADTLNIPIIATDIVGTQWMKEYGFDVIENTSEAILDAMYDFADGNSKRLGIDYEKYNKKAIGEFLDIIDS